MERARTAVIAAAAVTAVTSVAAIAAAVTSSDGDDAAVPATVAPGATAPAAVATVAVEIVDFTFNPGVLAVEPDTEVVWTNADGLAHSIVADDGSFASPDLDEGASFSFVATAPGELAYFCGIHDSMRATITVGP